jgi:protein-S-isoprenylcysteine O-methyltransferase Ste14
MAAVRYINLSCWLIFLLYWGITARDVKRTKEVTAGLCCIRWIVVLAAAVMLRPKAWSGPAGPAPHSELAAVVSVVLTMIGLAVAIAARRRLAGNWSSGVVLKENHELITSGLYAYVRHPIYSGVLLMALGTALMTGMVSAIVFFLAVAAYIAYKASQEEQLLTKHFPDEYRAYKSRVKALIPYVW